MASRKYTTTTTPWKRLVVLVVLIIALLASLAIGSLTTGKSRWTPDFALDLEGGTQIILNPVTTDGSTVTESDLEQAIEIIRQRVDASGVAEAEISSQGGNNIVVSLPGSPSQETLDLVRTSAVLRMRPVIEIGSAAPLMKETESSDAEAPAENTAEAEATEGKDEKADEATQGESDAASDTTKQIKITDEDGNEVDPESLVKNAGTPYGSQEELEAAAKQKADADGDGKLADAPATTPADASDPAWVTEQIRYEALTLDCTKPDARISASEDDPAKPLVACSSSGTGKYILGPAEIEGTSITQASSGYDQQSGQNVVSIQFDSKGAKAFTDITTRLYNFAQSGDSTRGQFAVVLDGKVISSATPQTVISGGSAQISGSFTPESAAALANQLSFGSLPLHFDVQSEEQISATLGSESLRSGLIAGLIGIVLIILYLLWQYHGLGVVAIGSITLAVGLSYLVVSLLSWLIGMRLSLAGVVALIISVGITADSFIVFFERIRDEQREGRSNVAAVSHGWERAKRTIIVADSVNLLAAVVLYVLAVGSVRGFAFTLGLTTLLDLIIVLMFTYPIMSVLVRKTKFFGEGRRFSGMDSVALGNKHTHYKGAGQFDFSKPEAQGSLADRRAAERRAEKEAAAVGASAVDGKEEI